MPTTPSGTPQISQSQKTGSVDELDLLVDSYLTLTRIPTWRHLMTTNGRWQHENNPHYLCNSDVRMCLCPICISAQIRTELVRTNLSKSDRNWWVKYFSNRGPRHPTAPPYNQEETPTLPPCARYDTACICWGYDIPCPYKTL